MGKAKEWFFVADTFDDEKQVWTVKILPTDDSPELYAELNPELAPEGLEQGDVFKVFTEDGEPPVVEFTKPGFWTEEEVAAIRRRATARFERMCGFSD